jgi:acyl-CoA thioester hydrolase
MPRVQIDLPEAFPFFTEVPILASDINFANHLGNDRLMGLLQEARIRFFSWLGYKESDVEGSSMILADAALQYLSEGFHGDVIHIEVAIGDFGRCNMDIYYRATNTTTGKLLCKAKTGLVFFDYSTRKVQPVPEKFKLLAESI